MRSNCDDDWTKGSKRNQGPFALKDGWEEYGLAPDYSEARPAFFYSLLADALKEEASLHHEYTTRDRRLLA
jgi:hypothetical protein